jgi:hypothetical protein
MKKAENKPDYTKDLLYGDSDDFTLGDFDIDKLLDEVTNWDPDDLTLRDIDFDLIIDTEDLFRQEPELSDAIKKGKSVPRTGTLAQTRVFRRPIKKSLSTRLRFKK